MERPPAGEPQVPAPETDSGPAPSLSRPPAPDPPRSPGDARLGAGDFHTGKVLGISAGHAVHDTYTAFLPPLLPVFIERMALSRTEAGMLAVFLQIPSLLQPVLGHLADRVSLRWFVIAAPAVAAVLMSLLGIAPDFGVMTGMLLLAGLNSALFHAVAPVMAGRLSGPRLGRGMSFFMVGGELGRTLGPVIAASAVVSLGLAGLPWLMVGGIGASALFAVQLHGVSGRPPAHEEVESLRTALRGMRPILLPLSGVVMGRVMFMAALGTYLPTFLTDEGSSLWFAGASLTVLEIAGMGGAFLGGTLSDRWGRRRMMALAMGTSPLFLLLFMMVDGWLRVPLLLALGFTGLSTQPVIMALVQESFPRSRSLANGVYMGMSFALRAVGTLALGLLGDAYGMRTAFTVGAVVMLATLPAIGLLPRSRRG